jgi:hypothetical protein
MLRHEQSQKGMVVRKSQGPIQRGQLRHDVPALERAGNIFCSS